MNQQEIAFLRLLLPIIKIGLTIWAVYRAKELNRSRWGWGIFTFFLTLAYSGGYPFSISGDIRSVPS